MSVVQTNLSESNSMHKANSIHRNETKSTDETCKQLEINQAQPDLGEAMAAVLQCNSCRLCKPTRQMTTACAKQHALTCKTNNKTCKQQQTNKAQPEICRRWMETVGALARILVLQQNLTNPCSCRFFFNSAGKINSKEILQQSICDNDSKTVPYKLVVHCNFVGIP